MKRVASILLLSLLAASCVAETPSDARDPASGACAGGKCDGAGEAGELPLERLPARAAAVLCRHAQVCNASDARLSILTEAECVAEWTRAFADRFALLRPALESGRLVYEPARAAARLAEIEANVTAGRCLVDGGIRERHLFRGTVAEGATCWGDECAGELSCVPTSGFACTGVCTAVPPAPPTGSCESDDGCLPEEGCEEGTCRALSPAAAGESCHRSAQCPTGLFCQPAGEGAFRCAPPVADGEACDGRTVCGRGRVCRLEDDGSHVCGLAPGDGDICEGNLVFCRVIGLTCDYSEADEHFRCRPEGREGEACTGGDCAPGLRCDTGDDGNTYPGTCRPARPNGEPCRDAEDCLGDWCGADHTCVGQFGSLGCAAEAPRS